jgi:hypothetical protein
VQVSLGGFFLDGATMTAVRPLVLVLAWVLLSAPVSAAEPNRLPDRAKAILDKCAWIHLLSLDPESVDARAKSFRTWRLLGQHTVRDAKTRDKILAALNKGLATPARSVPGFSPRYAIRASHNGKTVDLLICFDCGWVFVYYGGKKTESAILRIGKGAESTFAQVLEEHSVPLAKLAPKRKP